MSLTSGFYTEKFMTVVESHDVIDRENGCKDGWVVAEVSVKEVRDLDKGLVGTCDMCGAEVEFSKKRIAEEIESNARQMRSEMNDLFYFARELHVQAFTAQAEELVGKIKSVGPDGQSWSAEYILTRLAKEVARTIRYSDERQYGNMG